MAYVLEVSFQLSANPHDVTPSIPVYESATLADCLTVALPLNAATSACTMIESAFGARLATVSDVVDAIQVSAASHLVAAGMVAGVVAVAVTLAILALRCTR